MNLASQFSTLKVNTPLPKYSSWDYRVDPIEYVTDTETHGVSDDRVKANQLSKRRWIISTISVKKTKFQEDRIYYSSGGEDSDGEDSDSDCGLDSEIATEQDDEWIACLMRRAELSAARVAARAAASAIVN
ncbi:hypothetical protein M378DRAFT_1052593 [Amanita muscaria Koide BX008]|uniref:Uncharacterized protein n=1 Tax=Amanita muscaria (strain Koide BX008) TaxID=946122 RepID=A0A0C2WDJ5_AMAMK|nr:hypothetical protein M378DRAFT_1052593 [Amanita muscaria Koide BX008]